VARRAGVLHHDDPARLIGCAPDRERALHAELRHVLPLEHVDRESELLAQGFGGIRKVAWITNIARQIAQIFGERHAFGNRTTAAHGVLKLRSDIFLDQQ
jgi:hypothetical protein